MRAFLSRNVVLLIVALYGLFLFSRTAFAAPLCSPNSLEVWPPIMVSADLELNFTLLGCDPNVEYRVEIYFTGTDQLISNTSSWLFRANSSGNLTGKLANFVPTSGVTYPLRLSLVFTDLAVLDDPIIRDFQITGPAQTNVECGERVPPRFTGCKLSCPASTGDNINWFCGGPSPIVPPPPPARPECAFSAQISRTPNWEYDANNKFSITTNISTRTLPAGTYRFHIYNGVWGLGGDYVSPSFRINGSDDGIVFASPNNLDRGYTGESHELFLEPTSCNDPSCGYCNTSLSFPNDDEDAPIYDPNDPNGSPAPIPSPPTPEPSESANASGDAFAFKGNCESGTPGVQTAVGCFPADLTELMRMILGLAIGMAGGIAFLLIIFGGLRVIMSAGNPEAMNEGKEVVTSALVGLMLIIFSVFILRFIGVDILKIPGFV